jgi:hypothetical protein
MRRYRQAGVAPQAVAPIARAPMQQRTRNDEEIDMGGQQLGHSISGMCEDL